MDLTPFYNNKDQETRWIDTAFYVGAGFLVAAIFCYCAFSIKVYFLNRNIAAVQAQISQYGSGSQKAAEEEVFAYKKKIDDFSGILKNHKIPSNLFAFIEANTLPNVWFSSFDMSSEINEFRLSGQAENMETLSRQFKLFEDQKEYVRNISVLNSQISSSGKITFLMDMFVTAKMFEYSANGAQ